MNNFSADDIFNKWLSCIKQSGDKYNNSVRTDHIDNLIDMLYNNSISFDEAKVYRKKVIMALTHEEGRKGKGKYGGWKEQVGQDFDMCVCNCYIKTSETKNCKEDNVVVNDSYMPEDSLIKEWAIREFGEGCTEDLIKESHKIGSFLNINFLIETFDLYP